MLANQVVIEASGSQIGVRVYTLDSPPSPFTKNFALNSPSLDVYMFTTPTLADADNSWNNESSGNVTYRGQLQSVNWLISLMVTGVVGVEDAFLNIKDPYNFEQARNLTNETVSQGSGFVVEIKAEAIPYSKVRHSLWPNSSPVWVHASYITLLWQTVAA